MKLEDLIGLAFFVAFGLWWVALPDSVLRLYAWFHKGSVKLPKQMGIRLAGLFWIILVSCVWTLSTRH